MLTPTTITISSKDIVAIVVEHQPSTVDSSGAEKRAPRRRTTGRNQQLNVKATLATIEKFYAMADAADVPLGELLDRALNALVATQPPENIGGAQRPK